MRENIRPPTMTIPIGTRLVAPAPRARAMGSAPKIVASEVIRIGRKRAAEASKAASALLSPGFPFLVCKFHDQDAVFRDNADQHDHADL